MSQQLLQKKPSEMEAVRKIRLQNSAKRKIAAMANVLPQHISFANRVKIAANLMVAMAKADMNLKSKSSSVRNFLFTAANDIIVKSADYINTENVSKPTYPVLSPENRSYVKAPQTQRDNSSKTKTNDVSQYGSLQECIDSQMQVMSKEDAISQCHSAMGGEQATTLGQKPGSSPLTKGGGITKRLQREMDDYKEHLIKDSSIKKDIPAFYRTNPFQSDVLKQLEDAKIEQMADESIKNAMVKIGLDFTKRDETISNFQKGTYVPKEHVKSGSTTDNIGGAMNAYITNRWLLDDSFRNEMLMKNEKNRPKIHSGSVNDSTPAWIKLMDYTRNRVRGLGNQ